MRLGNIHWFVHLRYNPERTQHFSLTIIITIYMDKWNNKIYIVLHCSYEEFSELLCLCSKCLAGILESS